MIPYAIDMLQFDGHMPKGFYLLLYSKVLRTLWFSPLEWFKAIIKCSHLSSGRKVSSSSFSLLLSLPIEGRLWMKEPTHAMIYIPQNSEWLLEIKDSEILLLIWSLKVISQITYNNKRNNLSHNTCRQHKLALWFQMMMQMIQEYKPFEKSFKEEFTLFLLAWLLKVLWCWCKETIQCLAVRQAVIFHHCLKSENTIM